MMLEPVVTNGAAILMIVVLWSTLVWVVTYMVMSEKLRDRDQRIEVLDWYCNDSDRHARKLMAEIADMRDRLDAENAPVTYVLTKDNYWTKEPVRD